MSKPFLTARWESLLMVNYEIEPSLLAPLVPKGTNIDLFDGRAYVSLVAFLFLDTRVKGIAIPFHRNFEEVNLRFYVKREEQGQTKRGVVFVKEIVPRTAIALTARVLYNENYVALPMSHRIDSSVGRTALEYSWKFAGQIQKMSAETSGSSALPSTGSHEEFIIEHYWGYTRKRNGVTSEYEVRHPSWSVQRAENCEVQIDRRSLYGPQFERALSAAPASSLIANGSEISVYPGRTY